MTSAELGSTGERVVRTSFFRMATKRAVPELRSLDVFGIPVTISDREALAVWFRASAKARSRDAKVMHFVRAAVLAEARREPTLRTRLARADVVLGDGPCLSSYAGLARCSGSVRHAAAETLASLLAAGEADDPIRLYLVGPGAERAISRFAGSPGLRIVGATERLASLEDINEACADVVLASGDQAIEWASENASLLDVGIVGSVGPSFDPAPPKRMGLIETLAFLLHATLYLAVGPLLRERVQGEGLRAGAARPTGSLPAAR